MTTQSQPEPTAIANGDNSRWLALTPEGALQAFGSPQPDDVSAALQSLLDEDASPQIGVWLKRAPRNQTALPAALERGWVEVLDRPIPAPDVRLDTFVEHLVGTLSGEQRAALGADNGFCLGWQGMSADEAEALCVAAADYAAFAVRQVQRGWHGAMRYVSFHRDAAMLMPEVSFIPFWVDEVGYWLIPRGEPLLNQGALVELMWGIKRAGARFATAAKDR